MEDAWSNEKCLELIDLYEKYTDLWDSRHPLYYHKKNRNESWQKVASHFDTDITSIKRKMFSLLGSFRIQKAKGKEIVGEGANMKEVYISKWFAFERMSFLLDQKESQHETENDSCDVTYEAFEIKEESVSDDEYYENAGVEGVITDTNPTILPKLYNNESIAQKNSEIDFTKSVSMEPKKYTSVEIPFIDMNVQNSNKSSSQERKSSITTSNKEESSNKRKPIEVSYNDQQNKIMRVDTPQNRNGNKNVTSESKEMNTNSIQIFGQYIASKLQGYSNKTRAVAEHAINNVLFEADLGWYENSSPKR